MELFCPLETTGRVPQEKFPRKLYNKSFIDQACSVKMAGYWPHPLLAKKELGQYPAILMSHLVNNPYVFTSPRKFSKHQFSGLMRSFTKYTASTERYKLL